MENKYHTSHLLISSDLRLGAQLHLSKNFGRAKSYAHITWIGSETETLKIAQIRDLQEKASFATTSENPQYFVLLGIDTATSAAQNALLKLVEEPPPHTQFLLVAKSLSSVLPTIQSRCVIQEARPEEKNINEDFYQTIINADIPKRIELAEMLKDRSQALQTATQLLETLHIKMEEKPLQEAHRANLTEILKLIRRLESNCNPQLVVEEAFLQLV